MTDTELRLGEMYTDRYTGISGSAMGIWAYLNGCFMVTLQPKGPDEKGEPIKSLHAFDTYLDDAEGNPVMRPQVMADRAAEILGRRFRDMISGLEGAADTVHFMLNGTEQVGLQPRAKDGIELPRGWAIDAGQLEEIIAPVPVQTKATRGGPSVASPRQ